MRTVKDGNKWCFKLVLILLVSTILKLSSSENDFGRCEHIVKEWAFSSLDTEVKEDKHILRDLLFFLHIPRTGGRTYFHCFLKKLYTMSLECPRSYDKLRFNPRTTNCRLLVTHDDYSMMSKLPEEKTSVVTVLRNPIDRVFSTYEFSIEVAARFLVHPNLTSATIMSRRVRSKTKGVSTLDIWPWKYLVPWMREDLFARREVRIIKGHVNKKTKDPYNMEDIVMPLNQYIRDPIAQDIIHNGATFQITGLTNNSYLPGAHEVRHCVLKYKTLGHYVVEVAKKRLDDMLYVGLTENHKESATMFADVVGAQVISQFSIPNDTKDVAIRNTSERNSSSEIVEVESESDHSKMTTAKLMKAYETCTSNLRAGQSQRRVNSLKKISPANFTKEARGRVPEALLHEIASLNSLDMEIYQYAQSIFSRQRGHTVETVSSVDNASAQLMDTYDSTSSSTSASASASTLWQVFLFAISVLLLLGFILLFVNAGRRTFKVKL